MEICAKKKNDDIYYNKRGDFLMWGPTTPLSPSSADGFEMSDTVQQAIKENFKMLLMTNPGERVMYPDFGVGMKTFLFSRFGSDINSEIQSRIKTQTAIYLPSVEILSIEFDDAKMDEYQLGIRIKYGITGTGIADVLDFPVSI